MTKEEKQLLLKDFCARLAYNPFCKVGGTESFPSVKLIRIEVDATDGILLDFDYKDKQGLPLQVYLSEAKPYLRPMSNMTKEEEETYESFIIGIATDEVGAWELTDWLNTHHFDYRGLIEKGLALEAPKDMYNIKEQ